MLWTELMLCEDEKGDFGGFIDGKRTCCRCSTFQLMRVR